MWHTGCIFVTPALEHVILVISPCSYSLKEQEQKLPWQLCLNKLLGILIVSNRYDHVTLFLEACEAFKELKNLAKNDQTFFCTLFLPSVLIIFLVTYLQGINKYLKNAFSWKIWKYVSMQTSLNLLRSSPKAS